MERRTFLQGLGGAAGLAAGTGVSAAETLTTDTTAEEIEILRDEAGEPHIYADSVYGLGYGNGYAQAGDRLFQMDAIRHVGYGDSAKVLGPGQLSSDLQVKRDLYSREEVDQQWRDAPPTFKEVVRGFADGVNRRMVEMAANGTLPAEFAALGHPPEPWRPQDTVAAINYLIGYFGVGGGAELSNAQTLYRLQENLGSWDEAFDAYADLNWLETTDDHYTSLSDGDVDVDSGETVPDSWDDLPDEQQRFLEAADPDAIETWGIETDIALPDAVTEGRVEGQGIMSGFKWGSNAVIVSGELSESGQPLLGGGPQMGFYKPPIPYEVGFHGAGYDMSGIGVTAAPAMVVGRTNGSGEDEDALGWTVTSGRDDMVDTIAVELDPDDKHRYEWNGTWHEMETRREQHVVSPVTPTLGGNPETRVIEQEVAYVVEADAEMPVIAWNPEENVAWCQRKTTRKEEVPGAQMWAETAAAGDLDEFEERIEEFPFTFNFHVISDSGDIAYYHTGKIPDRADGPDYRFPQTPSTHGWRGTEVGLGLGTHARNPERGYAVNWNNGPAPDWRAGDSEQNWGSIHRVEQLDRLLREAAGLDSKGTQPPQAANDSLDTDDIAEVIHLAALHDASAHVSSPFFADAAKGADDEQIREMGEYLQRWADDHADWFDDSDGEIPYTDGDGHYDQPGHAIYDEVRSRLQKKVFDVTTAPGEDGPGIDWDPEPSLHADPHGTVWDDVTFIDALRGDTDYEWFDGRRDELILEAMAEAAEALETEYGSADPADWLQEVHKSRFLPLGGTQEETMDMRNRASYNQVLDAAGWQSGDEATWQAAAGDVIPPSNSGVITADELVQAQAGMGEPDRLTNQLGLYTDNEYRPHPITRTQVEQVTVETTTVRTVSRPSTGAVTPSGDVPDDIFSDLGDALDLPDGFADD